MAIKIERRPEYEISETGGWFRAETAELMQEVAKEFSKHGIMLEVLDTRTANGVINEVKLRVTLESDDETLAPFWTRVQTLRTKKLFGVK